jgi:bisphosphoglycerate-independent phosphoglycerate mutase (AlkP superfamily)
LLAGWDDASGLVFFTSDHGNMEDLSTRRHTSNPVPGLLIGAEALREKMVAKLKLHAQPESNDGVNFSSVLAQVAPAILHCLNDTN